MCFYTIDSIVFVQILMKCDLFRARALIVSIQKAEEGSLSSEPAVDLPGRRSCRLVVQS